MEDELCAQPSTFVAVSVKPLVALALGYPLAEDTRLQPLGPAATLQAPDFELRFWPERVQTVVSGFGGTERRVFAQLDPEEFEHFRAWLDRELPVAKAGR